MAVAASPTSPSNPGTGLDANGMGATAADLDNDGRLDWFVTSISTRFAVDKAPGTGNFLYRNQGGHRYESVGAGAGCQGGRLGASRTKISSASGFSRNSTR